MAGLLAISAVIAVRRGDQVRAAGIDSVNQLIDKMDKLLKEISGEGS
jgi:hypothetical protein